MEEWIKIQEFSYAQDAYMAKALLESEEIHELALQMKPKPTNEHEIIR